MSENTNNTIKTIAPVSTEHKRDWTGKLNRSIESVFKTGIECQDTGETGEVEVVLSTQHDSAGNYFSTVSRQDKYARHTTMSLFSDIITGVYKNTVGARYNVKNLDTIHADNLAAFIAGPTGNARADAFRDMIRPV